MHYLKLGISEKGRRLAGIFRISVPFDCLPGIVRISVGRAASRKFNSFWIFRKLSDEICETSVIFSFSIVVSTSMSNFTVKVKRTPQEYINELIFFNIEFASRFKNQ